jgi:hypothetical protein
MPTLPVAPFVADADLAVAKAATAKYFGDAEGDRGRAEMEARVRLVWQRHQAKE